MKKKDLRKKEIKRRKNFFPTLVVTILSWIFLGLLIYFVDPKTHLAIVAFFIISFIALLFTFSILLANTRRGLITTLGLILFLFLRYLGIGNIINFLLILGVAISVDIYLSKNQP